MMSFTEYVRESIGATTDPGADKVIREISSALNQSRDWKVDGAYASTYDAGWELKHKQNKFMSLSIEVGDSDNRSDPKAISNAKRIYWRLVDKKTRAVVKGGTIKNNKREITVLLNRLSVLVED